MEDNSRLLIQSATILTAGRAPSAAVMSLMFDCTPSIRDALDSALALDSLEAPMRAEIAALAPGAPVPLSLIKSVAVAHRTAKLPRHCWVHVICAGSRPYVAPQPGVQRTKEFELYLERLKIKQENAVYDQMVKTTKKSSAFGEDVSISSETQSIRQQLSSGTNIIAAMATGFVLGWFLGRSMFYADSVMPYVVGLVGGILAMAVDVILFIIRSERDEMLKKNPPKPLQAVFKSKPLQMRPSQPTAGKATSSESETKASSQNKKTQ